MTRTYDWTPPARTVYEGETGEPIPAGSIRQTSWRSLARPLERRPPDVPGVYLDGVPDWPPVEWRWADTWRRDSIQRVLCADFPAFRFEVGPSDTASPGTSGDHPRAELFSVDPAEKRRARDPEPAEGATQFLDGEEYWACFAVYVPTDFPGNQRWSTLFQRKLDDRYNDNPRIPQKDKISWLSVDVNDEVVGITPPGRPLFPDSIPFCDLSALRGGWSRFLVHEKLSTKTDCSARVRLLTASGLDVEHDVGPDAADPERHTLPNAVDGADVRGHLQYGYYRANEPSEKTPGQRPGLGVVFHSALLLRRTDPGSDFPVLP